MKIVAVSTLRNYWAEHHDTEQPLKAWYEKMDKSVLKSRHDVEECFGKSVKIIADDRARFKISGNKYRLVVAIDYKRSWVFIKFVGTHAEYDKIDVKTINYSRP